MKVMSFFSEKGGVGKTTLTAMFASYLAYHEKEKVYVMDFDFPSYHLSVMRETDLRLVNDPVNSAFIRCVGDAEPYVVGRAKARRSYTPAELDTLTAALRSQTRGRDGYYLFDFPGRFGPDDPVYRFAAGGLIDMFVVPVDSDRQSFRSAMLVAGVVGSGPFRRSCGGRAPRLVALWNREGTRERTGTRDWYGDPARDLEDAGFEVLPVRVHDMPVMRRDPDAPRFLRSTLCWPETNVSCMAPYLNELFADIRGRLDGCGQQTID